MNQPVYFLWFYWFDERSYWLRDVWMSTVWYPYISCTVRRIHATNSNSSAPNKNSFVLKCWYHMTNVILDCRFSAEFEELRTPSELYVWINYIIIIQPESYTHTHARIFHFTPGLNCKKSNRQIHGHLSK